MTHHPALLPAMTCDNMRQAMVCTMIVSAFIAGSFHAQRSEHGLQVTTWHDAYGTMHMAHTQRLGSEEEQRIEAHKTEVLRLEKQVIPSILSCFELCLDETPKLDN
jgi:hypothetical protein